MLSVAIVALVFVALMIPVVAILVDSPLGRSMARRLEGGASDGNTAVQDLHRKVELLEGEVEDLNRTLTGMKDELQFVHRLLEKPKSPPSGSKDS